MEEKDFLNNTSCSGQEEVIHHFLDGELVAGEREAFLVHLRHCSTCRTMLAESERLFAELAILEEVAAPPQLADQVMVRLPAESPPQAKSWPDNLGLLVLAGQIAIGLGLLLLLLPAGIPTFSSRALRLPWLSLATLLGSLARWLSNLSDSVSHWLQQIWPPEPVIVSLNISPELGIGLVAGFGLAWLAGNLWLLRRFPFPTKNGGT